MAPMSVMMTPSTEHAGSLLQDDPRVARGRDLLELDLADRGAGGDLALVEDRALGRDGDHVLDRGAHRHLNVGVAANADGDVRILDGPEPLEGGRKLIAAGRQTEEAERALSIGHEDLRGAAARDGDGDTRQGRAL